MNADGNSYRIYWPQLSHFTNSVPISSAFWVQIWSSARISRVFRRLPVEKIHDNPKIGKSKMSSRGLHRCELRAVYSLGKSAGASVLQKTFTKSVKTLWRPRPTRRWFPKCIIIPDILHQPDADGKLVLRILEMAYSVVCDGWECYKLF